MSSTYSVRKQLPDCIEQGKTTTLSLVVLNNAGDAVTPTSGTITIYDAADTVLDATAVTAGATNTYSLNASVTTDRELSDQWLLRWDMTISGAVYTFDVPAYLVRVAWTNTITDVDLTSTCYELSQMRPNGVSDYSTWRNRAEDMLQRALLKKGRRPWLVFDKWALTDAHIYLTLSLIFDDWYTSLGGTKHKDQRDRFSALYEKEMDTIKFRIDKGQTGKIESNEQDSPTSTLMMSAGRPASLYWKGR